MPAHVTESYTNSPGFSLALLEYPALVPPTPAVNCSASGHGCGSGTLGEDDEDDYPWPAPGTASLRANSRQLNRKLPPTLTESLEMLVLAHHNTPADLTSMSVMSSYFGCQQEQVGLLWGAAVGTHVIVDGSSFRAHIICCC
jgi:hypothetical protein